jgi:HTH-type transcriptional regulator, cell division transcriptional repressor
MRKIAMGMSPFDGGITVTDRDVGEWGDETATFGDRLAHARDSVGMSQAQLAHRMGLKLQSLRNWEENRSEPRANRLQMMAGMLNVSMVWLMTGQGEAPQLESDGTGGGAADLVSELRAVRIEQTRLTERLARLEFRLRRGPQ